MTIAFLYSTSELFPPDCFPPDLHFFRLPNGKYCMRVTTKHATKRKWNTIPNQPNLIDSGFVII